MGNRPSLELKAELDKLPQEGELYRLTVDEALARQNRQQVARLKTSLSLCWNRGCVFQGQRWRQYFLSDGAMTVGLSFEAGQVVVGDVKGLEAEVQTERVFELTEEQRHRLLDVCGVSSCSMLLGNSEHWARYVVAGSWSSYMCAEGASIFEFFEPHMRKRPKLRQVINRLPENLCRRKGMLRELYAKVTPFLRFMDRPHFLDQGDVDAGYNVVLLGPTGCGKSRLINLFFNLNVCESAAKAYSVTSQMQLVRGKGYIPYQGETVVNVMDTIGFCDTLLSQDDVAAVIQQHIKATMCRIDKVVMVCDGRLQPEHKKSMRQFLDWFNIRRGGKYAANAALVYTKADDMTEAERHDALAYVGSELGLAVDLQLVLDKGVLAPSRAICSGDRCSAVPLLASAGLSVSKPYSDIEGDLLSVLDAAFTPSKARIELDASSCAIL